MKAPQLCTHRGNVSFCLSLLWLSMALNTKDFPRTFSSTQLERWQCVLELKLFFLFFFSPFATYIKMFLKTFRASKALFTHELVDVVLISHKISHRNLRLLCIVMLMYAEECKALRRLKASCLLSTTCRPYQRCSAFTFANNINFWQ